jgi:mono/diheme cytochrome c family protein
MAPIARWSLRIAGGLVALLVVLAVIVYVRSEMIIGQTYPFRENPIALGTDSAALARGEHLMRLTCVGCHSDSLRGKLFFTEPGVARLIAPNVLEKIRQYSDAEFAGFLRFGVRKDGTSPFVMPPPGFYHLSDDDLGALLAYLRQAPEADTPPLPSTWYGPLGRIGLATGKFKPAIAYIDTTVKRVGADEAHRTTREGEYFARVICSECHSETLTGDPTGPSPSLTGALGYTLPEFTTLLRDGKPRGSNKLTLMAEAVKSNLHNFTDSEIASIYGYLKSLPAAGVALR